MSTEVESALSQINDSIGTDLSYVGNVGLPPSEMNPVFEDIGSGSTQRSLAKAAAEGLAKQSDSHDDVTPGMHLIVPHNAGGTSRASSVPPSWRHGAATVAHEVDGEYYFVTTLGSTQPMDVRAGSYAGAKDSTAGKELETWQAVGRLFGASTFDGGYSVEQRDGRRVITDISPMAARHTFDKYGARDMPRPPSSQPKLSARDVKYDETRGETVDESTGEVASTPGFGSDRTTEVPADAAHIWSPPESAKPVERWGRRQTEDGEVRRMLLENHIKSYTATALDAIERTLKGEPSTFDESRPPRPQTRCGSICDSITGEITETFEDGAALPGESGNSEGLEWEVVRSQGNFAAVTAELVDTSVPGNGTHALTLSETTGGGTSGAIATVQSYPGWNCEWTLTGRFYTKNIPLNTSYQTHDLGVSIDGVRGGIGLNIGFTPPGREFAVGIRDGTTETQASPEWSEETWYDLELTHDGTGRYEGRVWPVSESRPEEAMTVASGNQFTAPGRLTLSLNGAENKPFQVNYSCLAWKL